MCCNRCLLSLYDLPLATATVAILRAGGTGADRIPAAAGTMTAGIEVRAAAVMVLKVHHVAKLHRSMPIHTLDRPLATATVAILFAVSADRIPVCAGTMTAGIEVPAAAAVMALKVHDAAVLHGGMPIRTPDRPLDTATVAIRIVAGLDIILFATTTATTVTTGIEV